MQPDENDEILQVLERAWGSPFTTSSDFSRAHSDHIAKAACMGLLTVRRHPNEWGRTWRITSTGLQLLENAP